MFQLFTILELWSAAGFYTSPGGVFLICSTADRLSTVERVGRPTKLPWLDLYIKQHEVSVHQKLVRYEIMAWIC